MSKRVAVSFEDKSVKVVYASCEKGRTLIQKTSILKDEDGHVDEIETQQVAGCGEQEQVVVYKQGKYQGKPDTKPWDNEPGASLYTTSKWTKGDQGSWETAVKTRNQGQNEYTRAE